MIRGELDYCLSGVWVVFIIVGVEVADLGKVLGG